MDRIRFDWSKHKERADRLFETFKYSDAITHYDRALAQAELVSRSGEVAGSDDVARSRFDALVLDTLLKRSFCNYQSSHQFTGLV